MPAEAHHSLFLLVFNALATLVPAQGHGVDGGAGPGSAAAAGLHCPASSTGPNCPAVPLPAALYLQSGSEGSRQHIMAPSTAATAAGPLSHVLQSTLWLVTQAVHKSSQPLTTCAKLFFRLLFSLSWALLSTLNLLASPLKSVVHTAVLAPLAAIFNVVQSLQPFLLFLLAAVALGCATGGVVGWLLQNCLGSYTEYWSSQQEQRKREAASSSTTSPQAKVQIYSSQGHLLDDEDLDDLELAPSLTTASSSSSRNGTAASATTKHVSWAPILEHSSRARSASPASRRRAVSGAFVRKRGATRR